MCGAVIYGTCPKDHMSLVRESCSNRTMFSVCAQVQRDLLSFNEHQRIFICLVLETRYNLCFIRRRTFVCSSLDGCQRPCKVPRTDLAGSICNKSEQSFKDGNPSRYMNR
ncbi:hypothetical protein MPTK1_5g08830 [Marchantia polymorpha subsp. ruderalis]|uniref:Uncharacterized protein n=2 Tax=Marchantia polymorpha TaxID=3197 RepID=A0AAF6BGE3_MARPO|nr:hypothetical protein MARPO_0086s0083 [Marchantia polymorpha]BBN11077.1 hypothetical protein Mp_5g08830 [Marchantia polymorpha subsp. ruderalis]|eukprot:PTQ33769.1 hypothetical protein MARPO_0086s0083 [Marchantia polymorpha]